MMKADKSIKKLGKKVLQTTKNMRIDFDPETELEILELQTQELGQKVNTFIQGVHKEPAPAPAGKAEKKLKKKLKKIVSKSPKKQESGFDPELEIKKLTKQIQKAGSSDRI